MQAQTSLKKRLERWAKFSLLPPVGAALVWGIAATMRPTTRGHEELDAVYRSGGHIILAFWHAQQLMIPAGYRGTGANVLISQHGDGEIIARIIGVMEKKSFTRKLNSPYRDCLINYNFHLTRYPRPSTKG